MGEEEKEKALTIYLSPNFSYNFFETFQRNSKACGHWAKINVVKEHGSPIMCVCVFCYM